MTKYKNIAGAKIKAAEGVYVEDGEITDLTEEDAAVYLAGGYVQALDEDGIDDPVADDQDDEPELFNRKAEGETRVHEQTDPDKQPTRRRRF